MIFIPKKNIWTPKRPKGPRYQKGVLHPVGFWTYTPGEFTINESANVNHQTDTVNGSAAYAGIRLNTNGTTQGSNQDGSASWTSPVSKDSWLATGSGRDAWVEWENMATNDFNWEDSTTGEGVRYRLSSSCTLGVVRSAAGGSYTCAFKLHFYDQGAGGTLIGTIDNGSANAVTAARGS